MKALRYFYAAITLILGLLCAVCYFTLYSFHFGMFSAFSFILAYILMSEIAEEKKREKTR